jgi:hypothetical protein
MKFSELAVGDQFKYKNVLYTKTQPQKVSCCKTLNAVNLSNNQKVMVKPVEEVEKVNSDNE